MAGVTLTLSRLVQLARLAWRHRRWPVDLPGTTSFVLVRLGAGAALAIILVAFHLVLADIVEGASVDVLHTSIHPWDSARLGLLVALLALAGTAMWTGVTVLLAAQVRWRDHPAHHPINGRGVVGARNRHSLRPKRRAHAIFGASRWLGSRRASGTPRAPLVSPCVSSGTDGRYLCGLPTASTPGLPIIGPRRPPIQTPLCREPVRAASSRPSSRTPGQPDTSAR